MGVQSDKPDEPSGRPEEQAPARPVGEPPPAQARRITQPAPEGSAQRPVQPAPTLRSSVPVAIAVVVLLGAIVAGAALLVFGDGGDHRTPVVLGPDALGAVSLSSSATETASGGGTPSDSAGEESGTSESGTSTTTTATEEEADTSTSTTSNGVLPGVSTEQMQSEIRQMLLSWHEDVVAGHFRSAWELLSRRKQQQDEREYGYATWVKNQATLRPYLNPSGLQVSIEHVESSSGVAQVNLTGMKWNRPGAPCTEWSGITWVKYEDGGWKYDPGYSTTPQREREFKSRFSELLGGKC